MSAVILLGRGAHIIDQVTLATGGQVNVLSGEDSDALARALAASPPAELLLIDAAPDPQGAIAIADWAQQRYAVPVVLITDEAPALALPAMRAGVRDMISPLGSVEELRDAIARNRRAAVIESAAPTRGQIITVASPKGGVGKTTVATNLAVGLTQVAPERVVLVDLDLHFGDVASALNLTPTYTLPDTIRPALNGDLLALKTYLTRHETGLWVVAGSESPAAADAITSEEITALLKTLSQAFDYVVVDTSPGLSEHTLAALDLTGELVLVTGLDVPGVRGLRKEIETLSQLALLLESRHVVLNFADASRGLTVADVEATINAKVDVTLPTAKVVPISVNQGIPLLQTRGKDPLTRELSGLVARIAGRSEASRPRGRLFGRARSTDGTR
ncbi:Iron-sulfur cluster carrier protein [Tessaracoccus sp. O5.2]|uniref:AAA family ATPase n=1 Tax=Tessaracoccus sp. O5.2 TaxID=3157622 RepID=UPI0035EEEEDD